jgi:hypothetical protein
MLTRRIVLLGAASLAVTGGAKAEDAGADTDAALVFVKAIYSTYTKPGSDGVLIDSGPKLRRYFEPGLADVMNKDQEGAARRREVGALDFDPFIDAQDWEFKQFEVAIKDAAAGKVTATVAFNNLGTATTVVLDLVAVKNDRHKNDWRIYDITWTHDGKPETLRGLFKLAE